MPNYETLTFDASKGSVSIADRVVKAEPTGGLADAASAISSPSTLRCACLLLVIAAIALAIFLPIYLPDPGPAPPPPAPPS